MIFRLYSYIMGMNWIKISIVVFFQLLLAALMLFVFYPLFSWLILGEGGDSLLYTNGNKVVWILLPLLIPSIYNIVQIKHGQKNNNMEKVKIFRFSQIILMILYVPCIILEYIITGFRF